MGWFENFENSIFFQGVVSLRLYTIYIRTSRFGQSLGCYVGGALGISYESKYAKLIQ